MIYGFKLWSPSAPAERNTTCSPQAVTRTSGPVWPGLGHWRKLSIHTFSLETGEESLNHREVEWIII